MTQSRKLAAIMFTDIQGYTALMQESESKALAVREKHRLVFDEITIKYNGQIINYYGDGTLSIFDSAVDAVRCARDLQLRFLDSPRIPVRIGIHMGDILVTDTDVIGNSVNVASRVESLAAVGSVLFSEKVLEEISNHEDLEIEYLAEVQFKNDQKIRKIYALNAPGLVVPPADNLMGKIEHSGQIDVDKVTKRSRFKKPVKIVVGILFMIFLGSGIFWWMNRKAHIKKALATLPQIQRLSDKKDYKEAYSLVLEAEKYLKDDPGLIQVLPKIAKYISLDTEPSGAKIYRKGYLDADDQYEFIGVSPLDSLRTYRGASIWKFEKDGYHPALRLKEPWSGKAIFELNDEKLINIGMARIEGADADIGLRGFSAPSSIPIKSFLIDKLEITNAEFQKFVDAGGYQNLDYWQEPFVDEGQSLSKEAAIALFTDRTGQNAPAEWQLGTYPKESEHYPVTGISWYEAAAYAVYAGKSLPTAYHWNMAADIWLSDLVIPNSNIHKTQLAPTGSFLGLTASGVLDMAGNAREWCYNQSDWNGKRYTLGGGWDDPNYTYNEVVPIDPFDRSPTNGFRCIKYLQENENQLELEAPIPFRRRHFDSIAEPVSDEVFDLMVGQFAFDKVPFNAQIEEIEVLNNDRTCQKIIFDGAYNEKMSAYLFLPTNTAPPYQTVVYFPGTGASWTPSFDPVSDQEFPIVDFVLRSGRAVLFPILLGTYDRRIEGDFSGSVEHRNYRIKVVQDVIRSIDYLETRNDIDSNKLAYHGFSWGAYTGGIILGIEPRFKASILVAGGLPAQTYPGQISIVPYLPKIKIPVLMLNGRHDFCCFPLEASQIPMFKMLGTPIKDKKHIIFENAGHIPSRADLINESVDWYDQYLGPVKLNKLVGS